MNTIFGIPADTLMYILLVAFASCLAVALWVLIRHRVIFRMAVRNIPRRPAQTILIVIGLMLSTTIIAAALTTGDIMQHTIRTEVFNVSGYSDEFVVKASANEERPRPIDGVTFPESVLHDLRAEIGDDPNIDGMMPILSMIVPTLHPAVDRGQPALNMMGLDFEEIDAFGGLTTVDGAAIDFAGLTSRDVILGETPAESLSAGPGDELLLFVQNRPVQINVVAIAPDSMFTGMTDAGEPGGFAMTLTAVQEITGQVGEISFIAVTNRGDIASGVALTDEVVSTLREALAGTEYSVVPVKQQALELAEEFGALFSSIFLIFGMFSIVAGVLLIFLIFVLLAAERKPELGIGRAIGMRRRQITQLFMTEGLAYDLGAALVGALVGIGVAVVMVNVMTLIFSDLGFNLHATASLRSLTIAYTLGVVVTFITITLSAWRVSRITIVSAIRNLPDPQRASTGVRAYVLAIGGLVVGVVVVILGHLILNPFLFGLGFSVIPFSIAYLLQRRGLLSGRVVYSLASLVILLYWLFPIRSTLGISPDMPSGGIEMFVLSGLVLVAASTILIMWNADLITRGVALASRRFSRWVPAVKTAVSYPMANRGRTGLTVAMFSLIIFSLVMMASMNLNFSSAFEGEHATGGWDVQLIQAPNNPIDDLPGALTGVDFDTSTIEATGRLSYMSVFRTDIRLEADAAWQRYPVAGADNGFFNHAADSIPISTRATGFTSDREIWEAVQNDPTLAVIDGMAVPSPVVMNLDTGFELAGIAQSDRTMEPIDVELLSTVTGQPETVTIIGIIDPRVHILFGLHMSEAGFARFYAQPDALLHYAAVDGGNMDAVAASMEQALVAFGVQAQATESILADGTAQSRAILYLFEGFMALGLIVGIAALGVVSFRAVVERRQQIGMLRAIGYRRSMLAASFILESTIVTVLGVVSGVVLGLLLAWQVMSSEVFSGTLGGGGVLVPWFQVIVFATLAIIASLVMAWIPARQAARVPIAESLRYE